MIKYLHNFSNFSNISSISVCISMCINVGIDSSDADNEGLGLIAYYGI